MTGKKKIFILGPGLEVGGVERSLIGLLDCLDYSQVEVDLFLMRHTGEFMPFINKNVNLLPENKLIAYGFRSCKELFLQFHWFALTVKLIALSFGRFNRKIRKRGDDSKDYYQRMAATLARSNPLKYDLALGFIDPHYYLLNRVQAKTKIGWMHTDWATIGHRSGVKISDRMWKPLNYIACVSEGVKESFDKIFPHLRGKSIVVENALPQKFVRQAAEEKIPEDEMPSGVFNILSVGRFSPPKNFLTAIKCAKQLSDDGIKFCWFFIGYGPQEEKMQNLVKELNAEEYAIILGKRSNPYPYMKKCDLYVQPSNYEGKAVTVREAQMLAKPVLITNYATASSQLENGVDGHICELSKEGIVQGIKLLMNDVALREKYSTACALRDFSGREVVNQLMSFVK